MRSKTLLATTALVAMAAVCFPSAQKEAQAGPPNIVEKVVTSSVVQPAKALPQPKVEVVFALDTTSSMSGLIAGAKEKIWAIANSLALAKPAPQIKMGLVAYRDRGDAYVTKLSPLTEDLDAIYEALMAFRARGGGDSPESVNQGLYEAVKKMEWDKEKNTYRVVFLVGDCPPHMDYKDDVKYPKTCSMAREMGIVINTIQCGNYGNTQVTWSDIAKLGGGKYFRVAQSGGARVTSTPFDSDIAKASRDLDATRIYYGSKVERSMGEARKNQGKRIQSKASISAVAQRAMFNACESGADNFYGHKELLDDVKNNRVDIEKLADDQLPEKLRSVKKEDREKEMKKLLLAREELQKKIKELTAKRSAFINKKLKASADGGKKALTQQVYDTIKTQAADKEINYDADMACH